MTERPYFSIGEVLGLLLEEFPDVTISKIRFLETQGLIDPERTPSGYRKFYDGDVERLRFILREQKENYLPLRVIKERLDDVDQTLPNPPRPVPTGASWAAEPGTPVATETPPARPATEVPPSVEQVATATSTRPAAGEARPTVVGGDPAAPTGEAHQDRDAVQIGDVVATLQEAPAASGHPVATEPAPATTNVRALSIVRRPALPEERMTAEELSSVAGVSPATLKELVEFGLIAGRTTGSMTTYGVDALEIAGVARRLLDHGLEVRHLRAWRMAADKEVGLFEQLVTPLLRQRNPQAREQALATLADLADAGAELRRLLVEVALDTHRS